VTLLGALRRFLRPDEDAGSRERRSGGHTVDMTDDLENERDWQSELTPEQYHVLRERGTEAPFTGEYVDTKTSGVYRCAACGAELFTSDAKFDSGSGWPSFYAPASEEAVDTEVDNSFSMRRTEVVCSSCESHLGHLFPDGPRPTGQRYCINSVCLVLDPAEE
jgi:peptide-methionine (R)-S-oxide reductase